MGTFQVPVTIAHPVTALSTTLDALVDTGSTLTLLPPSVARQLGLEEEDQASAELADGNVQNLPLGTARLTVQGRTRVTPVLFAASDNGSPLLGAVTLEAMGWAVDPIRRRLVPQRLLLMHVG